MGPPELPPHRSSKGPSGLDLHPEPKGGRYISRRAGILCAVGAAVALALVVYGILEMNSAQRRARAAGRGELAAASPIVLEGGPTMESGLSPLKLPVKLPAATTPTTLTLPKQGAQVAVAGSGAKTFGLTPAVPAAAMAQAPSQPLAQPPAKSAAESEAEDAERRALQAPTSVQWASPGAGNRSGIQPVSIDVPPPLILPQDQDRQQNQQNEKERFSASRNLSQPVVATRQRPATKFVVASGWRIPATLETEINSDLPGGATAIARENVFDTATGRYLLIPQGSRFVGRYNSRVSYGQNAAQVIWDTIVFPDASSMALEGMDAMDMAGRTGLRDKVDNHYKRLILGGALMSMLTASFSLSQSRRGTTFGYPSAAETAGTAAAQQLALLGTQVTQRNLNIQPTIQIRPGQRFDVFVSRDLVFSGPYPE